MPVFSLPAARSRFAIPLLALTLSLPACLDEEGLECEDEQCVASDSDDLSLRPVFPGPIVSRPTGPCPTITSFSPGSGDAGDTVTINLSTLSRYTIGSNLTWVRFGGPSGANATFTRLSATQLRATVPNNAQSGTIAIGCYVYLTRSTSVIQSSQSFAVTSGSLLLENRGQYSILDFKLDGQWQGISVAPGGAFALPQPLSNGGHNYEMHIGPPGFGHLYTWSGTVQIQGGSQSTLFAPRITVNQALTDGRSFRDYEGSYVDQAGGHTLRLRFYANNNRYDFWRDNVYIGQASVNELSWANNSAVITFSLGPELSNTISTYPHASFTVDNAIDVSGQRRNILYTATN